MTQHQTLSNSLRTIPSPPLHCCPASTGGTVSVIYLGNPSDQLTLVTRRPVVPWSFKPYLIYIGVCRLTRFNLNPDHRGALAAPCRVGWMNPTRPCRKCKLEGHTRLLPGLHPHFTCLFYPPSEDRKSGFWRPSSQTLCRRNFWSVLVPSSKRFMNDHHLFRVQ